ncbi:MAG: TetR/AcrR family transcriptional regulator [Planctomycetota bacterium]
MKRKERIKQIAEQRRKEILDAAARIFARQGYRCTEVEQIADALKIGKGTVYRYFPTKRKLFAAVVEQGMSRLAQAIISRLKDITNPLERIKTAIHAHFEFFEKNNDVVEMLIQERSEFKDQFRPVYHKYYHIQSVRTKQAIQKCIDQKLIKPLDPVGVSNLLTDLFYGTIFTYYLSGKKSSLKEKEKNIVEIFFNNILANR